jgi:hypothetical protein
MLFLLLNLAYILFIFIHIYDVFKKLYIQIGVSSGPLMIRVDEVSTMEISQ